MRPWLEGHAEIIAGVAAMTAALMGVAVTFWPPTDTAKACWFVAFLLVGCVGIVGALLQSTARWRDQAATERNIQGLREDVVEGRRAATAAARRATNADDSLRNQAFLLADELEEFVAECVNQAPKPDHSLAGTARHLEWAQVAITDTNAWHQECGTAYGIRFSERVRLIGNDLARAGVGDNNMIGEANRQWPFHLSTAQVVAQQLRQAAEQLN